MMASVGVGILGRRNIVARVAVALAMSDASVLSGGGVEELGVEAPEDVDIRLNGDLSNLTSCMDVGVRYGEVGPEVSVSIAESPAISAMSIGRPVDFRQFQNRKKRPLCRLY